MMTAIPHPAPGRPGIGHNTTWPTARNADPLPGQHPQRTLIAGAIAFAPERQEIEILPYFHGP